MDHQSQIGPNGQVQQHYDHGSSSNNFLEGPTSFTDDAYGAPVDDANVPDYDFNSWNSELFAPPQNSTFAHQSPSPAPIFDHNARQPQQSSTPSYGGGISATLSPSPFSQAQAYDNRSLAQPSYDPRSTSRLLPSPSYAFQPQPYQNPNYPSRDQMQSPSQFHRSLSNTGMMLGAQQHQRPSPTTAQSFSSQPSQSLYQNMDPRQMHRAGYQGADMGHYSGFNEQPQQPLNQFISPQMLTSSGIHGGAGYQSHIQSSQPTQQMAGSVSPYMSSLYSGDPRMYQTAQSFQQSLSPGYAMPPAQTKASSAPIIGVFQGMVVPPKTIKPKVAKDPNAPKKPRGRPRKDGNVPRVKKDGEASSSEESDSEDELQVEEPEPEIKPVTLTLAPPTEMKARAVYDTVAAVWSPRNLPANPENVKKGGQLYSDTIRNLRDAWKPDNEALTAAENSNNTAKVAVLKEKVEAYRDTLKKILDRTDQYGHPAHLRQYVNPTLPTLPTPYRKCLWITLSEVSRRQPCFLPAYVVCVISVILHCTLR